MPQAAVFLFAAITAISSVAGTRPLPPPPAARSAILDSFTTFEGNDAGMWRPMTGTAPVSVVNLGPQRALRMPCNFEHTRIERASWDISIKMDLTMCNGLEFLLYCADPSPVASFTMYLHSGNGWYRIPFEPPASGHWNTVDIKKTSADIEGNPAGWANIDTVRISAWRAADADTEFYIAAPALLEADARIVIARGDAASQAGDGEMRAARQYAEIMARFLDQAGLKYLVLSDTDLTAARLQNRSLVILPYNPVLPENLAAEIIAFLNAGGKMLLCYSLPYRIAPAIGIRSGPHIRQKFSGQFASIRPSDTPLEAMPPVASQASWNILNASPVDGKSRIAAYWHTNTGRNTDLPAVIASENCVYLSHVLLADDPSAKLQLLLSMIGALSPDLWARAAQSAVERIGRFGPYTDYESAHGAIALAKHASDTLEQAAEQHRLASRALSQDRFSEAIAAAAVARDKMMDAYCLAQEPLLDEHRAFWCHSAFVVDGMTWDQAVKKLAENGFTAILPNMLWAGTAFYNSDLLPVAPALAEKGDQIELCLDACNKYGIECHVWKVNYNMGWAADPGFIEKMQAAGRTQITFDGSQNRRWLCPSHPENRSLEIESMLEVARKYDVDGLHFDYIRYPDADGCFCQGCRRRFEHQIARVVTNWPHDLRSDPNLARRWLDFRRQQITAVVAAVAERARTIRPGIRISAAVFRNWPLDRDSVGQEWKLWCDRGYLDFVCPMDYTESTSTFRRMIRQQKAWAGRVPCYPGIGLSTWDDSSDISRLIEQIKTTRDLQTGGFTIFNYARNEAAVILPRLGLGITRPHKGDTPADTDNHRKQRKTIP